MYALIEFEWTVSDNRESEGEAKQGEAILKS